MTRLRETPIVRVVKGTRGDFVATFTDRVVMLRPKRSRRTDTTITATWQAIYERALLAEAPKRRTRKAKRGIL